MAMTEYSKTIDTITNIGTNATERGLTTQEFKSKFDYELQQFVAWFNDTHKTEFDATAAATANHIANADNPHEVTAEQVGAATSVDLLAHTGNTSNPHIVTAAQIGAAATGALVSHTTAKNNPHSVTAAQIGAAEELLSLVSITANTTLALSHKSKTLNCSSASTITVTVPPNTSVAFSTGTTITIIKSGTGAVTIAAGSGVTIQSKNSKLSIDGQYAMAVLIKKDTNIWNLAGALV